jgi:hypothetical protein
MSWPSNATSSARRDRRQATLRDSLRWSVQNLVYPVKHKLKKYGMIKKFMTSGALTRGKEPEGDPSRKAATPFLGEEAIMTIYAP